MENLEFKPILVTMQVQTPIIPPILDEDRAQFYYEMGWISKEERDHLDRAFYRDGEGNPIITEHQLRSCINKAIKRYVDLIHEKSYYDQIRFLQRELLRHPEKKDDVIKEIRKIHKERMQTIGKDIEEIRDAIEFSIIDFVPFGKDRWVGWRIGYIYIPKILKTRSSITTEDEVKTTEYIEYIPPGVKLVFWAETRDPLKFASILNLAGMDVGFGAGTASRKFGRFKVHIEQREPKPIKEILAEMYPNIYGKACTDSGKREKGNSKTSGGRG